MPSPTVPFDSQQLAFWKAAPYHLSYHLTGIAQAQHHVGLTGERVLEIGGSLPEALVCDHLQAEQWIAVEDFEYWDEIPEADGSRPAERPTASLKDATPETTPAYAVLDGKTEQVPVAMEGHFTRAYSMACF